MVRCAFNEAQRDEQVEPARIFLNGCCLPEEPHGELSSSQCSAPRASLKAIRAEFAVLLQEPGACSQAIPDLFCS